MTLKKYFFYDDLWFEAVNSDQLLIAWNKDNLGFRVTYRDSEKFTRFFLRCGEQELISEIKKKINIELNY